MLKRLPIRLLIPWAIFLVLGIQLHESAYGQVVFKQPPPGSIYREYTRTMGGNTDWRVTDPNVNQTKWPEAGTFLPNPVLTLSVDDLDGATRAEAIFVIWGGHLGTYGKQVSFNGNPWIDLTPLNESNGIPSGNNGVMYMNEICEGVDVPLTDLKVGDNTFQGTNAGQVFDPNGWGQFGWFAVVLRIYYGPSKPHPTGYITSPTSGSSFGENPTITASVSGSVDRVDFLAFYDGYDTDGDGIYQEYHSDYHIHQDDPSVVMRNHVGTATSAPFQATWNTQWIPDQPAGGIKFIARIHDNTGMWFVTDEVTGLTLSRPNSSVKLYKATNVPQDYWVKQYQESNSSSFTIPDGDDLSKATDAIFLIRSWNGANGGSSAPNTDLTVKVDAWTAPPFGNSYYYSFDAISIGTQELTHGSNSVTAYCNSVGHGLEVLWPGPAVMVRYGVADSNQLPTITQQPANQTVSVGESATFTVAATSITALSYQWEKNQVAIEGATLATYTTPATTMADSGAAYRCIVTNLGGSTASNSAVLTVESATSVQPAGGAPSQYFLAQNYPNPFNPTTMIRFGLPQGGFVTLKVVNLLGQEVQTLVTGYMPAGVHVVQFVADELPTGMYLYRIQSGSYTETRKLVVLK